MHMAMNENAKMVSVLGSELFLVLLVTLKYFSKEPFKFSKTEPYEV